MIKRIEDAADIMAKGAGQTRKEALHRISVSTQCGFAVSCACSVSFDTRESLLTVHLDQSHAEGNALGKEDMRNKLELVRAIADDVWPGEP
jgi:hypothetical protein